jgi:opacity protein-like surface antigen
MQLCSRLAPAAALAAALAASTSARAEDFSRTGWYAGARGVYTQNDFDVAGHAEDDFGFNVFGGYRLFSFLASDFEFEYIDALRVEGNAGNPNFDVRTFVLAWNFRAYPLSFVLKPESALQRVQPYLSAGVSNQWVQLQRLSGGDRDEGNFAGRLGGGIDVYLTGNWVLTADAIYTIGSGDVSDFPYLSIGWGFAYRFGGGDSEDSGDGDEEEDEGEDEGAGE